MISSESRPWEKIPKWLLPLAVILIVGVIFFVSQYAASFLLSIYALARGWSAAQANTWLNNSVLAQFLFVLIFESLSVGLLYLLLKRYKRNLGSIGLKKPRLIDGGWALLAYPLYLVVYLIIISVVTHFYHGININQGQQIGFNSVHGGLQLSLTFLSLVILPPIAEELLFRGFLFEGLKKVMPVVWAGLLTSVVFAAAHLPEGSGSGPFWIGAIDVFILSLGLVYLKQKTKTLWPGIFLHVIKNLVAFISLFLITNR